MFFSLSKKNTWEKTRLEYTDENGKSTAMPYIENDIETTKEKLNAEPGKDKDHDQEHNDIIDDDVIDDD